MRLPIDPVRTRFMSSESGLVKWGCPTNSSRLCGRSRSANGAAAASLLGPLARFDGLASALPKVAFDRFLGVNDELETREDAVSIADAGVL
jgi:hypothetical protein